MTAPNPVSVYGTGTSNEKGVAAELTREQARFATMATVRAQIRAQLAGTTVAH